MWGGSKALIIKGLVFSSSLIAFSSKAQIQLPTDQGATNEKNTVVGNLPNVFEAQLEVNTENEGQSSDVNGLKIQMYTNSGNNNPPNTNLWGPNLGQKAFYIVHNDLQNLEVFSIRKSGQTFVGMNQNDAGIFPGILNVKGVANFYASNSSKHSRVQSNMLSWSHDDLFYIKKFNYGPGNHPNMLTFNQAGQAAFGPTATFAEGFQVSVEGKILAEEVRVRLKHVWPDYVFEPSYNLMPLIDLKNFITTHKHLPGIPSAQEVEEKGIDLGEMNALLLKQLEELTLRYIVLEERLKAIENQKQD